MSAVRRQTFVEFSERVLRLEFTPPWRVLLRVAIDGEQPADLEPEAREIAVKLFGPVDHIDPALRPWRVHAIAHDFHLEDLWAFELGARKTADVRDFLACFWSVFGTLADSGLARARLAIGRALRWDDHDLTLPIPGCTETTVCARLGDDDRRRNLAAEDAPSPVPSPIVKTAYVFPDEALYEFSNDTIHGLFHMGLAGDRVSLAVYVKHRGIASRLYMAAIWPARHLVLYPSLIGKIERAWQRGPPYPR